MTTITQPQLDLKDTISISDEEGNPIIFAEGSILRKGNRFLLGSDKDPIVPIPIMYNVKNNKILLDMIPADIRDEYKEVGFTLK